MKHILSDVNNYYLVIYTDKEGEQLLEENFQHYLLNPNIKTIVKPLEQWYNYKYKEYWIKNHEKNILLNDRTEWKLNMLWCEKIHFVNDALINNYFPTTEFYGWLDIGYFREGPINEPFPSNDKIQQLNKNKIYYACVNPNYLPIIKNIILNKNDSGLPSTPIPPEQVTIAGGFFIAYNTKIDSWLKMFDKKLLLYFQNEYLVKDDQMIIIDCIISEPNRFELISETLSHHDVWFQFRRYLCDN